MEATQDVDLKKLNEAIDGSGFRIGFLADELGITYQSFRLKREGTIPWKKLEKEKLISVLNMTEETAREIFLL